MKPYTVIKISMCALMLVSLAACGKKKGGGNNGYGYGYPNGYYRNGYHNNGYYPQGYQQGYPQGYYPQQGYQQGFPQQSAYPQPQRPVRHIDDRHTEDDVHYYPPSSPAPVQHTYPAPAPAPYPAPTPRPYPTPAPYPRSYPAPAPAPYPRPYPAPSQGTYQPQPPPRQGTYQPQPSAPPVYTQPAPTPHADEQIQIIYTDDQETRDLHGIINRAGYKDLISELWRTSNLTADYSVNVATNETYGASWPPKDQYSHILRGVFVKLVETNACEFSVGGGCVVVETRNGQPAGYYLATLQRPGGQTIMNQFVRADGSPEAYPIVVLRRDIVNDSRSQARINQLGRIDGGGIRIYSPKDSSLAHQLFTMDNPPARQLAPGQRYRGSDATTTGTSAPAQQTRPAAVLPQSTAPVQNTTPSPKVQMVPRPKPNIAPPGAAPATNPPSQSKNIVPNPEDLPADD